MIEINNILDVEKYIADVDVVLFDLDDTLYSEKDYVRSGYMAAAPERFEELWSAFLAGKQAFDVVIPQQKEEALKVYRMHIPTIRLYNGVCEMINRIKQNKRIGIITDGRPEGQRAKLQALGLMDIPFTITDELGGIEFRKPCKKAFEIMQKKFDVPFSKMVYVGDNIKKDFIAPEHLGMQTIWFRNRDGLKYGEV